MVNVSPAQNTINNFIADSVIMMSCDTILRHDYTSSDTFLSFRDKITHAIVKEEVCAFSRCLMSF